MNKAVALPVLTTLIAGCQSFNFYDSQANHDAPGLACVINWGQEPISAQEISSIRYLSKLGDSTCTMILGKLYESGRGVPQDIAKAKALYLSVADKDPFAYARLGRMAEEGVGQAPDLVEARGFYQRAVAKDRDPDNEAKLAEFMKYGKGGPQDLNAALAHYLNAARLVNDAPWKSVQRLRDKGLALTAEQATHYNEIWIGFFKSDVGRKVLDDQQALAKQFKPGSASQPVTLTDRQPWFGCAPSLGAGKLGK